MTTCEHCKHRTQDQCLRNPPSCRRIGYFNEYPVVRKITPDGKIHYQVACSQYQEGLK